MSIKIGILDPDSRTFWQTVRPLSPGSIRSRIIKLKWLAGREIQAGYTVAGNGYHIAFFAKPVPQRGGQADFILNDQYFDVHPS